VEPEVFLASTIYWISILAIGIWLSRRLSSLRQKLADLEAEGKSDEN